MYYIQIVSKSQYKNFSFYKFNNKIGEKKNYVTGIELGKGECAAKKKGKISDKRERKNLAQITLSFIEILSFIFIVYKRKSKVNIKNNFYYKLMAKLSKKRLMRPTAAKGGIPAKIDREKRARLCLQFLRQGGIINQSDEK